MAAVAVNMPPPLRAGAAPKRKSSAAGLAAGSRSVKRRASKACQCCRSRKVRCDVVESGTPCTNCRLDEVECCVTEGKRRRKSGIDTDFLDQHSPANSAEERDETAHFPALDDIDGLQDLSMPLQHHPTSPSLQNPLEQELNHHTPHMLCKSTSSLMAEPLLIAHRPDSGPPPDSGRTHPPPLNPDG